MVRLNVCFCVGMCDYVCLISIPEAGETCRIDDGEKDENNRKKPLNNE